MILDFTPFQIGLAMIAQITLILFLNWRIIFAVLPCLAIFLLLRRFYMNAQRHIIRLGLSARSPTLGHLSGTVDGVECILGFDASERCYQDYAQHVDTTYGCWYTTASIFMFFLFGMNVVCSLFTMLTVTVCLLSADGQYFRDILLNNIFCLISIPNHIPLHICAQYMYIYRYM